MNDIKILIDDGMKVAPVLKDNEIVIDDGLINDLRNRKVTPAPIVKPRTHVREGITKNKKLGESKARKKMAAASRRTNRK